MQVADVLADRGDGACVDMLARRVLNGKWQNAECAAAMEGALLTLAPHLLHRCLAACVPLWRSVADLVQALPVTLHQPLMAAAAAAADGAINVPHDLPGLYLTLLATTEIPPPGLQTMEICAPGRTHNKRTCMTPVQAALLARTLAAHSSLTNVNFLEVPMKPPVLERFAACLPRGALPRLAELQIRTDEHPGGCAAVSSCLKRLPSLSRLHIRIKQNSTNGGPSLASFRCAAASRVSLPSLVSLSIMELEGLGEGQQAQHDESASEELAPAEPRVSCINSFLPLFHLPSLTELCPRMLNCCRFGSSSQRWCA